MTELAADIIVASLISELPAAVEVLHELFAEHRFGELRRERVKPEKNEAFEDIMHIYMTKPVIYVPVNR